MFDVKYNMRTSTESELTFEIRVKEILSCIVRESLISTHMIDRTELREC